jgi:hypothetical protein
MILIRILRSSFPPSEVLSGRRDLPPSLGDALLGTLLFPAAGVTQFTACGNERSLSGRRCRPATSTPWRSTRCAPSPTASSL